MQVHFVLAPAALTISVGNRHIRNRHVTVISTPWVTGARLLCLFCGPSASQAGAAALSNTVHKNSLHHSNPFPFVSRIGYVEAH